MIVLMGIFVIGNILRALSATYWMLLGARVLVACCHGLFFGVALVLAMRVAPKDRQTTAVSLVITGVSLASVLGVPIGTAIGQAYGWRATLGHRERRRPCRSGGRSPRAQCTRAANTTIRFPR
jgi:DHA1 family inner membrane transport protein